jgi:YfiH family protein
MNPAAHVGDAAAAVTANRQRLVRDLALPAEPVWLRQVHGTAVIDAAAAVPESQADAAFSRRPGVVCAVLTADCLPVLLCDRAGSVVAAAHAGWRGLAAGIIERTVAAMGVPPGQVLAWLGPAIGRDAYRVGGEVRAVFVGHTPRAATAFRPLPDGGWHADLYQLARQRLAACGVSEISGGEWCTFTQTRDFYSYRRDGVTGRMASLIWLAPDRGGV